MKKIILLFFCAFISLSFAAQEKAESVTITISGEEYKQLEKHFKEKHERERKSADWARFHRYQAQNDAMKKPAKVVFLGNSITDHWYNYHPEFFHENGFTGRGIGGQTTSHMLTRFQSDIIDLKPKIVVIMAGTNDIARNNGIISHKHILQNLKSMCELAKYHKIKPILCSVLPAYKFGWNKGLNPAEDIKRLNEMIKKYAVENNIPYIDYYSAMVDERGGLPVHIAEDGVHPNREGYAIMEPIALKTIRKYIKK